MELFFGILILVLIFLVPLYFNYYAEETKSTAWKQFAQTNNLTFVPGHWLGRRSSITGNYKNCSMHLRIVEKDSGRSRTIYTRLRLEIKFDYLNNHQLTRFPIGQQLSVEQVQKLLALENPLDLEKKLIIQHRGRYWTCDMSGYERKKEYLQALLDFLAELSQRYIQVLPLGGDVVPALQQLTSSGNPVLRHVAIQLLKDIAESTSLQFESTNYHRLCPNCLTHYNGHEIRLPWWQSLTYYGCRTCGQSRQGTTFQGPLVAVLDSGMEMEVAEQSRRVRVNWLRRRKLFDFEWVEIVAATDEEVERFAVQVGNDTDAWRKPRYSKMTCTVSAQCQLSENTLRILERMFGKVKVEKSEI